MVFVLNVFALSQTEQFYNMGAITGFTSINCGKMNICSIRNDVPNMFLFRISLTFNSLVIFILTTVLYFNESSFEKCWEITVGAKCSIHAAD